MIMFIVIVTFVVIVIVILIVIVIVMVIVIGMLVIIIVVMKSRYCFPYARHLPTYRKIPSVSPPAYKDEQVFFGRVTFGVGFILGLIFGKTFGLIGG